MPSMMRRMRTRLPTYLSTGFGALVDISNTPWDTPLGTRRTKLCLRRQYRQILLGSVGGQCRKFEQRTDWVFLDEQDRMLTARSVCQLWISVRRYFCRLTEPNHEYAGVRKSAL